MNWLKSECPNCVFQCGTSWDKTETSDRTEERNPGFAISLVLSLRNAMNDWITAGVGSAHDSNWKELTCAAGDKKSDPAAKVECWRK